MMEVLVMLPTDGGVAKVVAADGGVGEVVADDGGVGEVVADDGGVGSGGRSSSRCTVAEVVVDGGGGLSGTVTGVSWGSEETDAHLISTQQQQGSPIRLPLHRRDLERRCADKEHRFQHQCDLERRCADRIKSSTPM